jgi:hypothetical protein
VQLFETNKMERVRRCEYEEKEDEEEEEKKNKKIKATKGCMEEKGRERRGRGVNLGGFTIENRLVNPPSH